jgi:hypothetical protein
VKKNSRVDGQAKRRLLSSRRWVRQTGAPRAFGVSYPVMMIWKIHHRGAIVAIADEREQRVRGNQPVQLSGRVIHHQSGTMSRNGQCVDHKAFGEISLWILGSGSLI